MSQTKRERLEDAYHMLAEQGYRPAARSITESGDAVVVKAEAGRYAAQFIQEEDSGRYFAGCTDFTSNRAAVLALEAFRIMNAGRFWGSDSDGQTLVPRLLRLAADEYEQELKHDDDGVTKGGSPKGAADVSHLGIGSTWAELVGAEPHLAAFMAEVRAIRGRSYQDCPVNLWYGYEAGPRNGIKG